MSARLTVDLDALGENFRTLVSHSPCGAVVKADAYGLGAIDVARYLQSVGCKHFFVSDIVEGARLRTALADTACIHVFAGASAATSGRLRESRLQPILNSVSQVACWRAHGGGGACSVHVDTGMARLGLSRADIEVTDFRGLNVESVLTHMARADEPEHPFNALQLDRFEAALPFFPAASISIGNSPAILSAFHERFDRPHLGRPGIGLYGGNPYSKRPNPMLAVALVEGEVLQTRTLPAGEPVGYGGTFIASRETEIATVGIGYADGVPRALSNIGQVAAGSVRCPIIGRVSMDLLQVDVTGIGVREGDWLEIFGREIGLDEMASRAGSFSYEVLTRIGSRVSRIYRSGSSMTGIN